MHFATSFYTLQLPSALCNIHPSVCCCYRQLTTDFSLRNCSQRLAANFTYGPCCQLLITVFCHVKRSKLISCRVRSPQEEARRSRHCGTGGQLKRVNPAKTSWNLQKVGGALSLVMAVVSWEFLLLLLLLLLLGLGEDY